MYETITKKRLGSGDQEVATLGTGHLNGLFVSSSKTENMSLTVRLRSRHATETLVSNMPFDILKMHSDLQNDVTSQSIDLMVQDIYQNSESGVPNVNQLVVLNDSVRTGSIMLPLGSITLDQGDELSIEIKNNGSGGDDTPVSLSIISYSRDRSPFHYFQYEYRIDDEQVTFHDCVSLIAYMHENTSDGKHLKVNPELNVKFGGYSYIAEWTDFLGAMAAMRVGNTNVVHQFVEVWENPTAIPETVDVRVTDNFQVPMRWLAISKKYIQEKTTKTSADELTQLRNRIEKLERESPETAKALRHEGSIPKSSELSETIKVIEKGNSK